MERLKFRAILRVSALAGAFCLPGAFCSPGVFCLPGAAQTVREVSPPAPEEKPIQATARPMLFSLSPEDPARADSVFFRSQDEMTRKDRIVAADAEAAIGERAALMGLAFGQGKWSYEQVVCPALPNHLFLKYMRDNGTGDVSMFSAAIPRGDDGRVRIVPLQLRGYSLFSPAPINALTISAFNHIRAEEHPDRAPDWLGTALCYAALAGGHPQAAILPGAPESQTRYPNAPRASLLIENNGAATLSFADISASPRPMEWTMTFDSKGRLLKATHAPAGLVASRTVHPAPVDVAGKAASDAAPRVVTEAAPPAPAAVAIHPAPPPAAIPVKAQPYPATVDRDVDLLKEKGSGPAR